MPEMSKGRRQFSLSWMFWMTFVVAVFLSAWAFAPVVAPWIAINVESKVRHFWLAFALTFSVLGIVKAVARLALWFRGADRSVP